MNHKSKMKTGIGLVYALLSGSVLCASLCLLLPQQAISQTPAKLRSTLGVGGSSKTVSGSKTTYVIRQSIAQTSVIGSFKAAGFVLHQGFIQPSIPAAMADEQAEKLLAAIYPNSFASEVRITFGEEVTSDLKVAVCDLSGRMVFNYSYRPTQELDIDLHFLASGLYVVRITSGKKVFSTKLIKD